MADPRAIHEFLTGEVEATTLLLGDFVDLDAQSGYTTYKASVSDIGEVILEDIEYTQDLQTVDKTIIGAINENKSVIGYSYDEYDPTTAYSKDDLCIYNNTLYKAKQATTGNLPTNTTYWEQTSIADEIGRIDTALSGKANIGNLFFGNAGTGFRSINGDATLDNIIDNNISSAGYFSIDHGGYITGLITTINRQFIYGWANSNRQYSWCLICTFGGIWYCKREGSTTYTSTKLI